MSCGWVHVHRGFICGLCGVKVNNTQQRALHEMDMHPAESAYLKQFGEFPVPPEVISGEKP
jgi:hypothetical protein